LAASEEAKMGKIPDKNSR